jgi:hypothetical protein
VATPTEFGEVALQLEEPHGERQMLLHMKLKSVRSRQWAAGSNKDGLRALEGFPRIENFAFAIRSVHQGPDNFCELSILGST